MRYRVVGIRFVTSPPAMSHVELQPATSLLDRPHRPRHEGRNMVAHAARLRAPWGLVRPCRLSGLCAVSLPLAAIVIVLALRCGLALRLGLATRLGLAFVLGRAVGLRSRRIVGAFGGRNVLLFRR